MIKAKYLGPGNKFRPNKFRNPDAFYWPIYVWPWQDKLSKKFIREQLKDLSTRNAKSV